MLVWDKGEQISTECSMIDRNSITEQLQTLKQKLLSLRKTVEQQIQLHETTAAEQAKQIHELEEVLDWFHDHDAEIHSRPLLSISLESVNEEIKKHMVCFYIIL